MSLGLLSMMKAILRLGYVHRDYARDASLQEGGVCYANMEPCSRDSFLANTCDKKVIKGWHTTFSSTPTSGPSAVEIPNCQLSFPDHRPASTTFFASFRGTFHCGDTFSVALSTAHKPAWTRSCHFDSMTTGTLTLNTRAPLCTAYVQHCCA